MADPASTTLTITADDRASEVVAALNARRRIDAEAAVSETIARPGPRSSEFLLALAALGTGLVLIAGGVYADRQDLIEEGVNLVQWATVGYAGARGLTKGGAALASVLRTKS